MFDFMFDPLLRPIVIPLVAGFVCLVLPRRWDAARSWFAVAATAVTLVTVWPLFAGVQPSSSQFGDLFRLDSLSGLVLLASACFALLTAVYSTDYVKQKPQQRLYSSCVLWSLGFACAVFLANDLILLITCWGLLAVTLYLMIGMAGPDASEAARKTFIIIGGSDTLLLLGTAMLWVHHGSTRIDAGALVLDSASAWIAFGCFLAAAFAKVGAVPLHSWLPDCGEKADAPVTAYLPAALDKLLGIYLLVRVMVDLFVITEIIQTLLLLLGAITILTAALMALIQNDLKRLLAYCAVGQVGYILLGLGTGTALGMAAALFHMLNHAVYKSCLFFGAGVVEKKTGTVDLDRLGGLATRLPITFAAFLIAALAVSGIPPLNGFASKWMVYQSLIELGRDGGNMLWVVWLAAAMMGSALTLALFVKVLHGVFLCKPSPEIRATDIRQASWAMALPMVALAGVCVVFGIFAHVIPLPLLIQPAVGEAVTFSGTWWAGQASGLLLVAFLVGWMVYALALRNGKLRKVPTYIGGERLDETRIPGEPVGPQRHVEVTGVDFYQTVEEFPALRPVFRIARTRIFDVYESCGKATARVTETLRGAHTGLLPHYLTWFVIGLLVILCFMMRGTG